VVTFQVIILLLKSELKLFSYKNNVYTKLWEYAGFWCPSEGCHQSVI